MTGDTGVDRTAVVVTLLADDAAARRLVLAWPLLPKRSKGEAERLGAWASLAGVSVSDAQRVHEALRGHGICLPDGNVDPAAVKLIEHVTANWLRSTGGGKR